jgi:hypothetical protein
MNKYNNKFTIVDNIKFHSKKEAERYSELKLLEHSGQIRLLELQPKFEIQPSFKNMIDGKVKTEKAINYIADFKYFDVAENNIVIEDCKGFLTEVYKIKRKLFLYKYRDKQEIFLES